MPSPKGRRPPGPPIAGSAPACSPAEETTDCYDCCLPDDDCSMYIAARTPVTMIVCFVHVLSEQISVSWML